MRGIVLAMPPSLRTSFGPTPLTVTASLKSRVIVNRPPALNVPCEFVTEVTFGATVSSVKANEADPELPAASVSLAMIVCG